MELVEHDAPLRVREAVGLGLAGRDDAAVGAVAVGRLLVDGPVQLAPRRALRECHVPPARRVRRRQGGDPARIRDGQEKRAGVRVAGPRRRVGRGDGADLPWLERIPWRERRDG